MHNIEVALLLRLIEQGECRFSARVSSLLERFQLARWVEPSTRSQVWLVREGSVTELRKRLTDLFPDWQSDIALLRRHGLDPLDHRSMHALASLKKEAPLLGFIHRKTWNAATAAGSKRPSLLPSTATLTDDWSLRGRVNCQTVLETPTGDIDLQHMTHALSEFTIPERGWKAATGLKGVLPRYIVTVENLGPLVDLELPPQTMLLFSQGAASAAAVQMLLALPDAKWLHFGDLDPAGISIGIRMAKLSHRPLHLYIPSFAAEYLNRSKSVKQRWPALPVDAAILRELDHRQAWMEQELFILDKQLNQDLINALQTQ